MADTADYPNKQDQAAGAIPTYLAYNGNAVSAGNPLPVTPFSSGSSGAPPYVATPMGYQQLSVAGTAVALTVPTGATFCYLFVETASLRYRDDGTNPTTAIGMPLLAGTGNFLYSGSLSAIKFISISGAATLDILYYK